MIGEDLRTEVPVELLAGAPRLASSRPGVARGHMMAARIVGVLVASGCGRDGPVRLAGPSRR